jgi:hypothetical protein
MASSGTDDEETAEFIFEADDEPPAREERLDPLGLPPENVVRAGRRFKLLRLELITKSGKRARPRFIYGQFRPGANSD